MNGRSLGIDRALLAFFLVAFGVSWGALGALQIVAQASDLGSWQDLTRRAETTFDLAAIADVLVVPAWIVRALNVAADFGPSFAALLVAAATGRLNVVVGRLGRWRVPARWYLVAFGVPAAVMTAAIVVTSVAGTSIGPLRLGAGTLGALIAWMAIRTLLGGGLGEELGWRGFALPRMQARMSPLAASAVLGLIWAAWHLPLVLVSDSPAVQAVVLLLFIAPLAFLYTWIFNGTGGSVLLVVLLHGTQNGLSAFLERSLLPSLADADLWIVFRILILLGVATAAAFAVRRQGRRGTVVRDGPVS